MFLMWRSQEYYDIPSDLERNHKVGYALVSPLHPASVHVVVELAVHQARHTLSERINQYTCSDS